MSDPAPRQVREMAEKLLASRLIQDPVVRADGRILEPVAILHPSGSGLAGWWVGVGAGDRMLGFFQLAPDLTFRRFSSFQRRPSSLDGCPPAADWLDPSRILEKARSQAAAGDRLAEPYLTYDRNPDRLAWAVRAVDDQDREKVFLVAGDAVWIAPASE
jgi:hypothetical protein